MEIIENGTFTKTAGSNGTTIITWSLNGNTLTQIIDSSKQRTSSVLELA
jgi:hypothetical protein